MADMFIPIWAFVLLCIGCLPTAVVILAVIAAFAFNAIDSLIERKQK